MESIKKKKNCLSKVYENSEIRDAIWNLLSEDFDYIFNRLVKELAYLKSTLVDVANAKRDEIEKMFIEYGYKLVTTRDLKRIIDILSKDDELYCTEF